MTRTHTSTTAGFVGWLLMGGSSGLIAAGCSNHDAHHQGVMLAESEPGPALTAHPIAAARWGALTPARGDAGPDGFPSPPHLHNATDCGIVTEGLIHNDGPDAEGAWMPAGSCWPQPTGEVHITSASGDGAAACLEIQHGPYLVMPPDEASDDAERAIPAHAANMIRQDASTTRRIRRADRVSPDRGPRVASLWGDPQDDRPNGALVALPSGCTGTLTSIDAPFRAVVIENHAVLHTPSGGDRAVLGLGSFVGSNDHGASCITWSTPRACVPDGRSNGPVEIVATPHR